MNRRFKILSLSLSLTLISSLLPLRTLAETATSSGSKFTDTPKFEKPRKRQKIDA